MKKNVEDLLKAHNVSPTAMRMIVLDHLLDQQAALSLADLEKALAPADRITIYRSLRTFESKGLVHGIDDGSGVTKYACCAADCGPEGHHDVHVHFVCRNCQETYCLPRSRIPEFTLPVGFQPEEVNLVVRGVCQVCAG
ncbi:transcriptional repressor [Pedobacter yulinensis]|uniref:Transcriptional repressor n=2 Tax=Pedobacter yulinensis TaxID=2126353 RepID=A0A2T3HMU5_9SPHI|nr:transcriptional repressor [Pedobacter yulinensis]